MKKIIVAFHIGRGGRFNNAGHKSFIGEKTFFDLITMNNSDLFIKDRDKKGKFCKPFLTDQQGNEISNQSINDLVGKLDFDSQYDTDYCNFIEDCDENELNVIAKSKEYKSPELIAFLQNFNSAWHFDKYGILTELRGRNKAFYY
jgi:hypothetical protein